VSEIALNKYRCEYGTLDSMFAENGILLYTIQPVIFFLQLCFAPKYASSIYEDILSNPNSNPGMVHFRTT